MADDLISHLKQYANEKPKAKRSDPPEIRQRTPSPQQTALEKQNITPSVTSYASTVIASNVTQKQPYSASSQRPLQKDTKPTALLVQSSVPTGNIISSQSAIVPTSKPVGEPSELDKEVLSVINQRLHKIETEHDNEYAGYGYQYPLSRSDEKETATLKTLGKALKNGTLSDQPEEIKNLYEALKSKATNKLNPAKSSSEQSYQTLDFHDNSDVYKY